MELLKEHGIEVKHALNHVGKGLQDHLSVSHYFSSSVPTLNNVLGRTTGKLLAGMRYVLTRSGPLSLAINQVGGLVRSDPSSEVPDITPIPRV